MSEAIAAGLAIIAPGNRILFLRRSSGVDHPGEWNFPGGHIEDGETPEQAAIRECDEEAGYKADPGAILPLCRYEDYSTFVASSPDEFTPQLNGESDGYIWATLDDPPEPLHPSLAAIVTMLATMRKAWTEEARLAAIEARRAKAEMKDKSTRFAMASKEAVLYHGTSSDLIDSIKENGLVPGGGKGADAAAEDQDDNEGGSRKPPTSVFMTSFKDDAQSYAEYVSGDDSPHPNSEPILLEIHVPADQVSKLKDSDTRPGHEGHELTFKGKIPPEWIKSYTSLKTEKVRKVMQDNSNVIYAIVLADGGGSSVHKAWSPLTSVDDLPFAPAPVWKDNLEEVGKDADTVSTATGIVNYDQTSASGVPAVDDDDWKKRKRRFSVKTQKAWSDEAREAAAEARRRSIAHLEAAHAEGLDENTRSAHADAANHYMEARIAYTNGDKKLGDTHFSAGEKVGPKLSKLSKGTTTMAQPVSFFMPFQKVEPQSDGSVIVTGYASTPTKDLEGEIISLDAVKKALPAYMEWRNIRAMHQANAVGTAKEAHVDDVGLFLRARIVEPGAVRLVQEEVYKGYSIGGNKIAKKGDTITDIDLIEISLVDRPCNSDCRFTIAKMAKGAGIAIDEKRFELLKAVEEGALFEGVKLEAAEVGFLSKLLGKLGFGNLDKRDVSDEERKNLAAENKAMPDGSYPIANADDLHNAVQSFGRAKDPAAVKQHIVSRAKALDSTHMLPADWEGSTKEKAARFLKQLTELRKVRKEGKLEKGADLYTVGRMCELLGQLEWLEECCEGETGFCCTPSMGTSSVLCDKEFTTKFGALLVQFADMTSELLGMITSKMKEEEAEEAAQKIAAAYEEARKAPPAQDLSKVGDVVEDAIPVDGISDEVVAKLSLVKFWSDEAREAAAEARQHMKNALWDEKKTGQTSVFSHPQANGHTITVSPDGWTHKDENGKVVASSTDQSGLAGHVASSFGHIGDEDNADLASAIRGLSENHTDANASDWSRREMNDYLRAFASANGIEKIVIGGDIDDAVSDRLEEMAESQLAVIAKRAAHSGPRPEAVDAVAEMREAFSINNE